MDYNDNDYQSKNLHLAGEDNSKVSSVLRPFALPRFDFDDSLQGHLRFDSLVENEVFLGIPCQEDNQWIEDFSRGSSGIEFSSSATESCSIPGRNNVWSEATSSESVEMLLKSVGQEHNPPEDTIVQESDGGNKLGNVTHEMEPSLQEDDKMDYVEDPIIGVQADQFLDKFSRSSEITEGEIDHFKCTLQVAGTSSENVANRESAETTTEKSLQIEMKNNDSNQVEVNASHNETLVNQNGGDPCVSGIQIQIAECSSYNDTVILGNPDVHDKINDSHQITSGLPDDFGKGGEDNTTVNKDISMDDKKLSGAAFESDNLVIKDSISNVTSEAEDVKELGVRNTFTNLEESSTLLGNEECDFLTAEGCKKNAPSTKSPHVNKSQVVVSSQVMESKHQPEGDSMQHEEQSVSFKSICASEGHDKEVRETGDQGSNLELEEGFSTQMPYEQSSFTEQEHNTIEKSNSPSNPINESSLDHGDDLNGSRDASIPAEIHEEIPVGEDLEGGNDASRECEMVSGDGNHVSSHVLDEPEKLCREDLSSKQPINTCNSDQNASSVERGETVSSVVASDVENNKSLDNHTEAGSSLVEECREHVENAHGSEFATSMVNKQASDTEVEDANRSSRDTVDSVSLSERSDDPAAVVKHCEKMPLSVKEGSVDFGRKEEIDTRCHAEANPSALDSSLQMASQLGPVSDVEKDTFVATPLTADHSITMMEAADTGTQTDQANVASEVHQDCSLVREIGGQQHDSVAVEGANDEKETLGKHEETDDELKKSSKAGEEENSKDQGAPDLGSAVDGTATQFLQTERKKKEVGNKGAVESVPPPQDTDGIGGKVQSMCMNSAVDSSKKETGTGLHSYPSSKTSELTMEIPQPIDKATPSCGAKGGSENKTRRRSGRSGRENSRKGKVKETPVKLSERVDNSCMHLGPSGAGQLVQFDVGSVQRSGTKTSNIVSNSASNLLDLNSSTPPAPFQQPFTDLQQVQLRAQIFVYGSLIQGAAPDEACMVSAFGTSDGGRSIWEPAWRSCAERLHGQKSLIISAEVPGIQSGSGLKTPDQPIKQDLHQSKVISSSAARPSSKGTSIPVITPMMPLSSPLWNIATPSCDGLPPSSTAKGAVMGYQAVSTLHPYQTPPMRNFIGQTTSWLSQTPLTASWVTPPQTSAFDISTRIPVFPITEPVNLTPVKEPSGVVSTGSKYAPPSPVAPGMLSGVLAETSSLIDGEKGTAPPAAQHSTEAKSRKRKKTSSTEGPGQISLPIAPAEPVSAPSNNCHLSKKAPSSEDIGQISLVARSQTETLSAPIVSSHFSTSVAVITPNFLSKCKSNTVASSVSVDHSKKEDANLEKRKLTSPNMNKIEEAKIQAEEAAEHAAAALGHCQGVWSQLDKQKNSGLMSDIETKLASAAATIAAAASVAKAAAAAAKIASNAASQARQMADEALVSSTSAPFESRTDSLPEFVRNLGSATPASILKGGDEPNGSGSIIFAAREAARRRVEAASAAARHAENLVAIVKAAELAAEAVSHAGKVVAMGDPLTLSELVEAGPDGYWKVSQAHCEQGVKSNDVNVGRSDFNGIENASDVCLEKFEGPSKKALHALTMGLSPLPEGISANTIEGSVRVEEGMSSSIACAEKDMRGSKGPNTSELTKTPDVSTKPEMDSRSTSFQEVNGNNASSKGNDIKEGCLVEVFRDSGDFNDAWFLANVLSLKDGNAFVCYTELQSDKGSGHLKEWIPLGIDGDEVPRIRPAHPMTSLISEGARKRRRAAVKEYSWSVGDQVDAWIHDCWREGIIIEKNKKDETTFTVNFPARGDNAVVRVWHLRPRLVWKDGEWIEWFTSKEQSSFQGDTPKEKRMKLGNPASEAREKAKVTTNIDMPESGANEETKLLPLSADEKIFNVGSKRDENKPNTLRTMRSGLQKEGPKVIFGVPKPGKKRKFMEVSKHYDSDRGIKTSSANESAKFAKYVMPTGSGVGGWKNNSKTDPKEKLMAESRSKPLKSRKPPTSSKILKDSLMKSTPTTSGDATSTDHVGKDIISYDKSESGQSDSVKFGPNAEDVAEDSIHFSSEALPAEPTKKASKLKNKSEQLNKGRLAAASGKSIKDEVNDKSNSEISEPRRSNRRIQPTSRLLEGLQSSLIISKFPSVSHDKSHKSHNRGTSKGNSHG